MDRKQAGQPRLSRAGRSGDPEPFDEDTTVLGRQRLRQLRRLVTFQQGVTNHLQNRFAATAARASDGWPQTLHNEWKAIKTAVGYGSSFPSWVLQWQRFSVWPTGWPPGPLDFLEDLVSFVRFDLEALNRQHAKVKKQLFRFHLQVDESDYSCAKTFARVRPEGKPPFRCVQITANQTVQTLVTHSHQLRTSQVRDASKSVSYMGVPGQVTDKRDCQITVLFPQDDDAVLPLTGQLLRSRQDCTWCRGTRWGANTP